ncbi:PP2C family serine/threonine-protein phosphatase [Kribbella sp. NPDC051718]|uniref:PP2C family protein-serine/threonine phosphatase n=1 Tax=Kribbella sp. NPDC051718 TaxID=3155168 RepID=UPI00343950D2
MTALRVAAITDVGRVRSENQDCVLLDGWVSARDTRRNGDVRLLPDDPAYVVAVCDGLGGHAGGSVASRLAAMTLALRPWPSAGCDAITERVIEAARNIQQVSDAVRDLKGLGSTVAGIAVTATEFSVFSVGDSSVFRAADGSVGELTVPDRRPDPHRPDASVLTQSLSVFTSTPDPAVQTFPVLRPVRLLACSDGLTDVVDAERLRSALGGPIGRPGGVESAARALVAAALEQGAPDNVSVIVLDLIPSDEHPVRKP